MAYWPGSELPPDVGPPISFGYNVEAEQTVLGRKYSFSTQRDVKAERTISGRKYSFFIEKSAECFRDETNDGCVYEDDVSGYLPPLAPKLTKAGKVAVHQPRVPKQALKWWKAQCGFRGLPVSGTASALQERVRSHGAKGLGRGMEEARNAMRVEYGNEVERRWEGMKADEKVAAWPRRFLHEAFPKDRSSGLRKVIHVVDVGDWGNAIDAACRTMRVCCKYRKMPHHRDGQRTVVLGIDEQAVRRKFDELNRNAEKAILKQEKERVREKKEKSRAFESSFLEASKIQKKKEKGNWDVSGKWTIDCPYVQEQWGGSRKKSTCGLDIKVTTPNKASMVQIWANFDFIVLTGVFRFVNPDAENKTVSSTGHKGDDSNSQEEESAPEEESSVEESSQGEESDDEGTSRSQFLLSRSALPSSTSKKFQFRWRGEDTGTGEIQLYSDKKLCHLNFETKDALSGVFKSDCTGTIKFRGVRERSEADKPLNPGRKRKHESIDESDPADEWRSRSESAYEEARVGRWG